MKRRSFLRLLGISGGGLVLGVHSTGCLALTEKTVESLEAGVFQPNAFLSIHQNGRIQLAISKSEMGQGIMTAFATLVAEELEVPISKVEAHHAFKLEFGAQSTGGSTSTRDIFKPVREAAASAREMLRMAAAETWAVDISECIAKDGAIHHRAGRSLSYGELTALAATLPVPSEPALKSVKDFTVIGKGVQRVDGLDKCTGKAKFGTDVDVEGKVCAYVMRPPIMGGQVRKLNAEEARKERGVLKIFAFSRGVAIIAEKYWQAKRASQRVEVEWDDGILKGLNTQKMASEARKRSREKAEFVNKKKGNVRAVFGKEGMKTIEAQYDFPYLSHAPMEPQNCTAAVYQAEGKAKLWVPTQSPTLCAQLVSRLLDIPLENVAVEVMMLGGGFGRRSALDFVMDAILIAKEYPETPVQVIWSREDDMTLGYYRPQGTCFMKGAVDSEGQIAAIYSHLVSQSILPDGEEFVVSIFPMAIPPKLRRKLGQTSLGFLNASGFGGFFEGGDIVGTKYELPVFQADYTPINVGVPVGFWRSVAHSYSTFIMETFMDQLAHIGGQEPTKLRKKLLQQHPRYLNVLDTVVSRSAWGEPIADGWGRGFAISEFFGSVVAQVVEAGIVEDQITVRQVTCVVDCGLVVNPDLVRAQVESAIIYGLSMMTEKIELVDGVVQQQNFDGFPVLRMHEIPEIETILISSEEHPSGIGEIALPPVNAAVSNAIFAATGYRLTNMPLQEAWENREQRSSEVMK